MRASRWAVLAIWIAAVVATASAAADRPPVAQPPAGKAAAATPAATRTAPRVIDALGPGTVAFPDAATPAGAGARDGRGAPRVDPLRRRSPEAAAEASQPGVAEAPTLTEVVKRIEQILRDTPPARAVPRAAKPPRAATRPAPAPATPEGERSSARGVRLTWAEPQTAPPGVRMSWPPDLDPRRPPLRPLGQRLRWAEDPRWR